MKGVIFNLLEEAVTADFGDHVWSDLIDAAGVHGGYTSLGSYPDEDILVLVSTAAAALGKTDGEILQWFGRAAMPMLAQRYSEFFVHHASARPFILSVNEIIHPEVRKLYSGAGCPYFHFEDDPEGHLLVGYRSARQMCQLAHGFIEGAAGYYGERVSIDHQLCMQEGDPLCRMAVAWNG
ncbi:heme NO-binding domain-containing protein [Qipengyuania sp. MTN3-11]|uniref:heme NO-binding domain-containing protein n=1 Tax=Qipengyuania sp. MTN3-11 TaxID=3056557 RepID=UPI0036F2152B